MKPRLLVIGVTPPPLHGVSISTMLVLANPALARDFDIEHVDTSDRRDLANIGRLDWLNVWLGLRSLYLLARRLHGPPGVVYLPLSQGTLAVLRDSLYIRLAAARRWRVAVHLRGGEFREFYAAQPRPLRWWIVGTLRRASSVAVMGACLRSIFEGLVPSDRIAVVANGTPELDLDTSGRDPETGLFLGNLFRRKGVVEAMQAAMIVLRQRPAARFIFAGEWQSGELERAVREGTAQFGDRVEFAGIVGGEAKRDVLARAGYLLFPPVEPEGHPRVVLEAHAAGLPVVTTDRGAIRETVVDGETGFVLPEPVPELLAERILLLLGEPGRYERMARAARERHLAHFTQEAADGRLARWLADVAARRPAPRGGGYAESMTTATARRSSQLGQRMLVGLDAVGSRVLPFGHAPDISAPDVIEERFAGQLHRAEVFGDGFSPPLEVKDRVVLEIGAGLGAMQASFLRRGAAKAIALEPNEFFAERIPQLVGDDPRLEVVCATIEQCPLPDDSVDAIVSDAVFEHIEHVPEALREVARILKPGGMMFAKVGQTWFHYNGPHLITYLHVPWVHLMFSEATIRAVLERYKAAGRYPGVSVDSRIEDLDHMNRLSQRGLKAALYSCGLEVLQCENSSPRAWKSVVGRLPVLKELLPGDVIVVLRKPRRAT